MSHANPVSTSRVNNNSLNLLLDKHKQLWLTSQCSSGAIQNQTAIDNPLLQFKEVIGKAHCILLIDSGASSNFISQSYVSKNHITSQQTQTAYNITLADGSTYHSNQICRVKVRINSYNDQLTFVIVPTLSAPLDAVLGIQWLKTINPFIDWVKSSLQFRNNNQMHLFHPTTIQVQ